MIMIACSSMALVLAIIGHYGCLKVNIMQLQATMNLFINWLLGLTLTPRFNQTIMGYTSHYEFYRALMDFTRPLWNFLGLH